MKLGCRNVKTIAAVTICMFLLQSCVSTHYSVQSGAKLGEHSKSPRDTAFAVNLTGSALTSEDRDIVYSELVSALNEYGLKPPGPEGSDYDISITLTNTGEMNMVSSIIAAVVAGATVFILPLVLSAEMVADVQVRKTGSPTVIERFRINYSQTTCGGLTPIAYLCTPNKGALGKKLGSQIAIKLRNFEAGR